MSERSSFSGWEYPPMRDEKSRAELTAERDALAAENARLREAVKQVTSLFVDYPDDEESGGTVFYPHCAYMLAFPYPRPAGTPTCKAWKEQIIAAARALVEAPR